MSWWESSALEADADAFAERYAQRSGVPVEQLRSWGRFPEPCDCGDALCERWAMGHQWEEATIADMLRGRAAIRCRR